MHVIVSLPRKESLARDAHQISLAVGCAEAVQRGRGNHLPYPKVSGMGRDGKARREEPPYVETAGPGQDPRAAHCHFAEDFEGSHLQAVVVVHGHSH